jgi:hypothetical protein
MSEATDDEKLERLLNDPKAIDDLMKAKNISRKEAEKLWKKLCDEVRKLKRKRALA